MKLTFKYLFLFTALTLFFATGVNAKVKKMKLKVLYLGGQVDWTHGEMGSEDHYKSEADFEKDVQERQASFGNLLSTYFTTVKTMQAKDWTPEISKAYDVTIFDGVPPVAEKKQKEYVYQGKVSSYSVNTYLPEDYDCPSLTIASIGNRIGQPYGCKNDWLCLCLDAHAHGMNLNHAIFKGPFKTTITQTKQPTPEDAKHYAYFQDGNVPDSVMMWRVNTLGYETTENFNIGMVSRPWGYLDSPDCEFISSGVCAKTIDAVAIGRHANFLTWGFVGSPKYMTEEAKVVFANAVAYISKFRGTPLVRKYNERISTREYIKEVKYCCTHETWEARVESDKKFYDKALKTGKQAREKQARGETLNADEKYYVNFTEADIPPVKSYGETMKEKHPDLYAQFGEDEAKYVQYYTDNTPYFYGGIGSYTLIVDADAKAWGIANNDKRLLDKAISCLEKGVETERANRILKRYTLCEFTSPTEWRNWYDKYQDKMFFTESGGWYFMVNEKSAPGNDYTVAQKREDAENVQSTQGNQDVPTHDNPVVVSVKAEKADRGGVDMVFNIQIMNGYHIYNAVADSDPYIPFRITYTLPDGAVEGERYAPIAKPFVKEGTTIYEGEVSLRQNISIPSLPATIKCVVECQCCDDNVCMPPLYKEYSFTIE